MGDDNPAVPAHLARHAAACFAGTSFDTSRERVLQDLLAWVALGEGGERAQKGKELVRGALARSVAVRRGLADQLDQHRGALQREVEGVGRLHDARGALLEQGEAALGRELEKVLMDQTARAFQVTPRAGFVLFPTP